MMQYDGHDSLVCNFDLRTARRHAKLPMEKGDYTEMSPSMTYYFSLCMLFSIYG